MHLIKKVIIISSCIILYNCNNEQIQNELKKFNLKGQIISFSEFEYKVVDKFGKLNKIKRERSPIGISNQNVYINETCFSEPLCLDKFFLDIPIDVYDWINYDKEIEYDKSGNIINIKLYNKVSNNLFSIKHFRNIYDSKNNLISRIVNKNKVIINKYDDNRKIKEKSLLNNRKKIIFKYLYKYRDNKVKEILKYSKDGSLNSKIIFSYNTKNNLSKISKINPIFKGSEDIIYKYNNHNKITKIIKNKYNKINYSYNEQTITRIENCFITSKIIYRYDRNNNISEFKYFENNKCINTYKYTYHYDDIGNITKRECFRNGIISFILIRTYKYS